MDSEFYYIILTGLFVFLSMAAFIVKDTKPPIEEKKVYMTRYRKQQLLNKVD